jgi:hypothetical protein
VIENTNRLRHKIDSGRTGDKVAGFDPTVAALGTDDEAAGKPPTAHQVASAHDRETMRPHESPDRPGLGHAWILIAFTMLFATAIVVWAIAMHGGGFKQYQAQVSAPVITTPVV